MMSGFFSAAPRRERAPRRTSDRETQRRTPTATAANQESNSPNPRSGADTQSRAPTPTATSSTSSPRSINLAASTIGSSARWESYELNGGLQSRGLSDATEEASALFARLFESRSYLDSAESAWDELCTARRQLHTFLNCATSPDEQLRFTAVRTLGNIYGQLGDYDKAHSLFISLCPPLPLTRTGLGELQAWHKIDALLYYVPISAINGRDLDQLEQIARMLPWATPDVLRTEDRKVPMLLSLIRILNCKGRHADAYDLLEIYELTSPLKYLLDSEYRLQKAIAAAGKGFLDDAEALFADALVLASLSTGVWNGQTLHVLYEFGRALQAWRRHESALKVLTVCCHGYSYMLRPLHPRSIQAYTEFQLCKGADKAIESLRHFDHFQSSRKRRWLMAYEYTYLITPIELLTRVGGTDYDRISEKLEQLLKAPVLSCRARFNAKRNLAWCSLEQGNVNAASTALYGLHPLIKAVSSDEISAEVYRALVDSDEAICFSRSSGASSDFTRQRSKLVYSELRNVPKNYSHQVKAILRRLTNYGLTHFTHEVVFSNPPLIAETNREKLDFGTYGTVDTVKVGEVFYARKSTKLGDAIRTEVKIIHALDHAHIVRVLLTYEEKRQFSVIMHPLADSDLETYLASKICEIDNEHCRIWKWMVCIVNSLAFIHSKGIRHKDVKPKNVLVNGEKIYFTDFGSGHMFSDDGNSTTTGPAYGHTRAFCAPEVIRNDNRNRLSDIFSLGCVLAEMAAWSCKIPIAVYHNNLHATGDITGPVIYHDSIERVRKWFEESSPQYSPQLRELYQQVLRRMIRKKPESR